MRLLWKLIKYFIMCMILSVALIYVTGTKPKDILTKVINISMQYKGLIMEKSDWNEFDFINISMETQAVIFGGLSKTSALVNYKIRTFYPFDGDVGFVGGSDYKKQHELQNIELFDKKTISQEDYDMYWPDKHETAYLFRTDDDGKSFTKIDLLKGSHVTEILKYKDDYYAIVEDYLWNTKTFVSKDKGKNWSIYNTASIEAFFDTDRFIFSKPTGVQTVQSVLRFKYFYTKDGGKTSLPLSDKIINYAKNMHPRYALNFRMHFNIYNGKLLFIEDKSLISVDIDTLKEKRTVLKFPKGYKLASYASREYGKNLYEWIKTRDNNLNVLQINKENGKPYIILQKDHTKDNKPEQISMWYPFENKHIIFDKEISQIVPLKVSGNYIGGFIKKASVLVHIWTLDNGENWKYEVLPDYYLLVGPKVMNNKVWMTALVRGERPDGKEGHLKVKGSFLVMGTLKTNQEKVSKTIPQNFILHDSEK